MFYAYEVKSAKYFLESHNPKEDSSNHIYLHDM